jgi:hypothetical protein
MRNEKATWPQRFATVQIGRAINQSLLEFFSLGPNSSSGQQTIHLRLMTKAKKRQKLYSSSLYVIRGVMLN